jgi:acyl-coenzyme A thioesterase PaaI-like protein
MLTGRPDRAEGDGPHDQTETDVTATTKRRGPFWDSVEGRAPMPPAAATLGFEFVDADVDAGTIELAFTAADAFTTPMGDVLGGFLAAMVYDTVGPCLLATLAPDEFIETIDLHTRFVQPAFPGRITGRGRIVHRAGDLAALEATLSQPARDPVVAATAAIRIVTIAAREARTAR